MHDMQTIAICVSDVSVSLSVMRLYNAKAAK